MAPPASGLHVAEHLSATGRTLVRAGCPYRSRRLSASSVALVPANTRVHAHRAAAVPPPPRGPRAYMPPSPTHAIAGLSGPPPGEIVDGLRNPYLDKFIPPRRREASKAYRAYKPIQPQYLTCALDHDFSKNDVDTVAAFVETLNSLLHAGARTGLSSCPGLRASSGCVSHRNSTHRCASHMLQPFEGMRGMMRTCRECAPTPSMA